MKMPVNRIIEDENDIEKEWLEVKDEEELEYIEL